MTFAGFIKFVIIPMGLIGTLWGEPICSLDDPRLNGWDNPEQYIEEECND